MAKKNVPFKLYDLIPSQESMYLMIKYSIHKQVLQIPTSVTVKADIDFSVLKKAFNIELSRNDSLRLRFIKVDKTVKQYFLPAFAVTDIPVLEFTDEQQMQNFFDEDAQTPVRFFKDETFRIRFFKAPDGRSGIYFNVSHMVMDAFAVAVFYKDLLEIYRSLTGDKELPDTLYKFEDYIKEEFIRLSDEKKMQKDKDFFIEYYKKGGCPFYAGVHGHDLLDKARAKAKDPELRIPTAYDPIHDKALLIEKHISAEDSAEMYAFCKDHLVSPESLMQLGFRAHVSKINYDTNDTFSLQLCSKRVTYKEKAMGGCLCQPMQVRAIINDDEKFADALIGLEKTKNQLYRHMNYPYVEAFAMEREMYGLKPSQAPSFMMYTWLPMLAGGELGIEFKGYGIGHYVMPLYVFMYPLGYDGGINCTYMYRINRIKPEHIDALHENMLKAVKIGISDPDISFGDLKKSID